MFKIKNTELNWEKKKKGNLLDFVTKKKKKIDCI